MSPASLNTAVTCLRDEAAAPDLWPKALPLIAQALDGIGAACFARNERSGEIEWAHIFGPVSEYKSDYIDHYARLDPYIPVLAASEQSRWLALLECLPGSLLRHNTWYQDYARRCGIGDVLGVHVFRTGSYRVFCGVQYGTGRTRLSPDDPVLQQLLGHLEAATRLDHWQRQQRLAASVGGWALRHGGAALFVTCDRGRIVGLNDAAEQILAEGRSLTVRRGRLVATDALEAQRLATLIARATATDVTQGRLIIGGADTRRRSVAVVFRLDGTLSSDEHPLIMVRIVSLFGPLTAGTALADLFGLTPAEERLARGLMQNRTLQDLTVDFNLKMPTLRAQLRSVLRKCGVRRQVDLLQVLLRAQ